MSQAFPGIPKVVQVSHLSGIDASYRISNQFDSAKPTLVMINSFATCAELYRLQFENAELNENLNLLAIEPLGHGKTRLLSTTSETFTFWDSAIMALQVLDALDIAKAFVLGTSQGGFIAVRMALLRPEKISALILLGTSLDSESARSQDKGCWNAQEHMGPILETTSAEYSSPEWQPPTEFYAAINTSGFGERITEEQKSVWADIIKSNYTGEDGRKRLRQATINLVERDGLWSRLADVKVPVLRMHGGQDTVYSVAHAEVEMALLINSKDASLRVVQDGPHYLSAMSSAEVDSAVLELVERCDTISRVA